MRRWIDRLVFFCAGLCAALAVSILAGLVAVVVWKGFPALSGSFFIEQIRLVGAEGGIFFNLVGTLILIATALAVSGPVAIGMALVHGVYLRRAAARRRLALGLYVLNGVPSILFGIFGLIVFVKFFGWGKSWLTGGILLGAMILPTVTVSLMERVASVPQEYLSAATGLGLSRSRVIWSVILPQSFKGWVTGSLLGLGRAAGEVAPIMFTATIFSGASLPHGVKESPVLSLPYHIFILAQDSFDPAIGSKVWGTAVVLLLLVLALSVMALPARIRMHEEARRV